MQNSILDFLGSSLVPVLSTDITAGSSRNVHLGLITVLAVGAFPNELAVFILLDEYLAVVSANLAEVTLGIKLSVHNVVVDKLHNTENSVDVVLHIGNLYVRDCAAGRKLLELAFKFKLGDLKVPDLGLIKGVDLANKINHGFSFNDIEPVEAVKNARVPMFFVHGKDDNLVPSFMAEKLYESCCNPDKDILLVEGADHAQAHVNGKDEYEQKLDEFIGKYVK